MLFVNTFYLLPIDKIPWPLPPNYGQKGRNNRRRNDIEPSLSVSELVVENDKPKLLEGRPCMQIL